MAALGFAVLAVLYLGVLPTRVLDYAVESAKANLLAASALLGDVARSDGIAFTRAVSPMIEQCELTHLARTPINYARAVAEHDQYEDLLRRFGCRVERLPDAAGAARLRVRRRHGGRCSTTSR
jgi:hypothetical protein